MSRGKKLFAMTVLTFIALLAVSQFNNGGDTTGAHTADTIANNPLAPGVNKVPVSQVGLNHLASQVGHLGISINFTWLLLTGFLVLFMQVGFAFLVTGLTRAKNAGHMMMMNLSSFVDRAARLLHGRLRVPVRWRRWCHPTRRNRTVIRDLRTRQRRCDRDARVLPAVRERL